VIRRAVVSLAFLVLAGMTAMAGAAPAVSIDRPRVRWLPGQLPMAGYMVLRNTGDQAVTLVGAASDAFARVMIHRSEIKDGQSRMVHVPELEIQPGGKAVFQPGGLHLMLMQRKRDLRPGDTVDIELKFEGGRTRTWSFKVVPAGGE